MTKELKPQIRGLRASPTYPWEPYQSKRVASNVEGTIVLRTRHAFPVDDMVRSTVACFNESNGRSSKTSGIAEMHHARNRVLQILSDVKAGFFFRAPDDDKVFL